VERDGVVSIAFDSLRNALLFDENNFANSQRLEKVRLALYGNERNFVRI
jgi:hypothetical protein